MKEYTKIKIKPEVVYQHNEDGMMLYVPEDGMVHAVNLTAADIILFVEQGKDNLEMLANEMMNKYIGISKEELLSDIEAILNLMEENKILEGN